MPMGGEIVEINEVISAFIVSSPSLTQVRAGQALESSPGLVNESAMEDGWFIKVKVSNPSLFMSLSCDICCLDADF